MTYEDLEYAAGELCFTPIEGQDDYGRISFWYRVNEEEDTITTIYPTYEPSGELDFICIKTTPLVPEKGGKEYPANRVFFNEEKERLEIIKGSEPILGKLDNIED